MIRLTGFNHSLGVSFLSATFDTRRINDITLASCANICQYFDYGDACSASCSSPISVVCSRLSRRTGHVSVTRSLISQTPSISVWRSSKLTVYILQLNVSTTKYLSIFFIHEIINELWPFQVTSYGGEN